MKKLPHLPIGNSSFEVIRKEDQLYVDKTRFIHKIADEGMYYFLSRPRRFGKSLTISTFRCLFQGKKELFKGLWIDKNTDWEWKEYPVILFEFNKISHETPEHLKQGLENRLREIGEEYRIELGDSLLMEQFIELILSVHRKSGMPVVILVDAFDSPLIDSINSGGEGVETAKANQDIIRNFFGVLKAGTVISVLKFVFITGVFKFSQDSIYSELNNLSNITMNRHYADMFGFTNSELISCFSGHIEHFAEKSGQPKEQIIGMLKKYYNGYRFSEKDVRVYNPFSILKSISEQAFKNYWFETGTPTFLVNLLRERDFPLTQIENMEADEATFSTFDIDNLKPEALLFQTGYITIKEVEDYIYTFSYPNREVKLSFLKHLLFSYTDKAVEYAKVLRISSYLQKEQFDDFFEAMSAVFASVPYTIETRRDEAFFHTIFYLTVSGYGVHADSEILTSEGRIDLVLAFSDRIYVMEFKCNQNAEAAIRQIQQKNYAMKYRKSGKKIILMGINFDTEKRNISEWKWEPDAV